VKVTCGTHFLSGKDTKSKKNMNKNQRKGILGPSTKGDEFNKEEVGLIWGMRKIKWSLTCNPQGSRQKTHEGGTKHRSPKPPQL